MTDDSYRRATRHLMDKLTPTPAPRDLPAIMGLDASEMIEFISLGTLLPVNPWEGQDNES